MARLPEIVDVEIRELNRYERQRGHDQELRPATHHQASGDPGQTQQRDQDCSRAHEPNDQELRGRGDRADSVDEAVADVNTGVLATSAIVATFRHRSFDDRHTSQGCGDADGSHQRQGSDQDDVIPNREAGDLNDSKPDQRHERDPPGGKRSIANPLNSVASPISATGTVDARMKAWASGRESR